MGDLVKILETFKLSGIETYVQSGNAVFQSTEELPPAFGSEVAAIVESRHGFRPLVFLFSSTELERIIDRNPFPAAEAEPKTLHLFFLDSAPEKPRMETLVKAKSASERFVLNDRVLYLHAPDGIGRSKLASNVEKILGVAATARNWRTVTELSKLAKSL